MSQGFRVLRYWNHEVFQNGRRSKRRCERCCRWKLRRNRVHPPPHPQPLSRKGRGGLVLPLPLRFDAINAASAAENSDSAVSVSGHPLPRAKPALAVTFDSVVVADRFGDATSYALDNRGRLGLRRGPKAKDRIRRRLSERRNRRAASSSAAQWPTACKTRSPAACPCVSLISLN